MLKRHRLPPTDFTIRVGETLTLHFLPETPAGIARPVTPAESLKAATALRRHLATSYPSYVFVVNAFSRPEASLPAGLAVTRTA